MSLSAAEGPGLHGRGGVRPAQGGQGGEQGDEHDQSADGHERVERRAATRDEPRVIRRLGQHQYVRRMSQLRLIVIQRARMRCGAAQVMTKGLNCAREPAAVRDKFRKQRRTLGAGPHGAEHAGAADAEHADAVNCDERH